MYNLRQTQSILLFYYHHDHFLTSHKNVRKSEQRRTRNIHFRQHLQKSLIWAFSRLRRYCSITRPIGLLLLLVVHVIIIMWKIFFSCRPIVFNSGTILAAIGTYCAKTLYIKHSIWCKVVAKFRLIAMTVKWINIVMHRQSCIQSNKCIKYS